MKHIIFGGDGFLGTELTKELVKRNERVLICDEKQSLQFGNYELPGVEYLKMDVTDKSSFDPIACLLYTSPSPRDRTRSRMPSSA